MYHIFDPNGDIQLFKITVPTVPVVNGVPFTTGYFRNTLSGYY
jgi:hypothetical protein